MTKKNSVPKTSSGKVQRKLCLTYYEQGDLREIMTWAAPKKNPSISTPHLPQIEDLALNWLQRKVGDENLTVQTNLSNVGLDSITMAELLGEIENKTGQSLPEDITLADCPTIKALVEFLSLPPEIDKVRLGPSAPTKKLVIPNFKIARERREP